METWALRTCLLCGVSRVAGVGGVRGGVGEENGRGAGARGGATTC